MRITRQQPVTVLSSLIYRKSVSGEFHFGPTCARRDSQIVPAPYIGDIACDGDLLDLTGTGEYKLIFRCSEVRVEAIGATRLLPRVEKNGVVSH